MTLSLESLLYQGRENDLKTILIDRCKRSIEYTKQDEYSALVDELNNLSGDIHRITGINVKFILEEASVFQKILGTQNNAFAEIFNYDKATLFNSNYLRESMRSGKKPEVSRTLKGSVDQTNFKVTGVFSTITSNIYLYVNLLDGTLEPEELAGIITHELGHVYTSFIMLGYLTYTVAILGTMEDIHQRYATNKDVEVKLSNSLASYIGEQGEPITQGIEPLAMEVVNNASRVYQDYTGLGYKSTEDLEYLADQFTSRIGLAKYNARAMIKINRTPGVMRLFKEDVAASFYYTHLKMVYAMTKTFLTTLTIPNVFFVIITDFLFSISFSVLTGGLVSRPNILQRLESLRSDQITILKRTKGQKEREHLIKELDDIDLTLKRHRDSIHKLPALYETIKDFILLKTTRRNIKNNLSIRQNNPLYELYFKLEAKQ